MNLIKLACSHGFETTKSRILRKKCYAIISTISFTFSIEQPHVFVAPSPHHFYFLSPLFSLATAISNYFVVTPLKLLIFFFLHSPHFFTQVHFDAMIECSSYDQVIFIITSPTKFDKLLDIPNNSRYLHLLLAYDTKLSQKKYIGLMLQNIAKSHIKEVPLLMAWHLLQGRLLLLVTTKANSLVKTSKVEDER